MTMKEYGDAPIKTKELSGPEKASLHAPILAQIS